MFNQVFKKKRKNDADLVTVILNRAIKTIQRWVTYLMMLHPFLIPKFRIFSVKLILNYTKSLKPGTKIELHHFSNI